MKNYTQKIDVAGNWLDAIIRHSIPEMYREANFDDQCEIYLTKEIVEKGKKWIDEPNKPSLFLTGIPGCGKTYFMTALLRGLTAQNHKWHIFKKSKDLFDQSLSEMFEGTSRSNSYFINKICEVPFLFLDDVGIEKMTERVQAEYYQIIDSRISNNRPFIFTSNLSIENFGNLVGERVKSRLELCYEIQFKDQDLRKELFYKNFDGFLDDN